MALFESQVVTLAELIGETPDATRSALDSAARIYSSEYMAAVEAAVVADLTTYGPNKNKEHMEMSGGKSGIDLKYGRLLKRLRVRNRRRLGLSVLSDEDAGSDPSAARAGVLPGPCWS